MFLILAFIQIFMKSVHKGTYLAKIPEELKDLMTFGFFTFLLNVYVIKIGTQGEYM